MNDLKKIKKVKNLLDSILKETSENNFFQELRIKTKQSLVILENLENKIIKKEKKAKTIVAKKPLFSNISNSEIVLKTLEDQINQQKQEIKNLEKNSSQENTQTFFD